MKLPHTETEYTMFALEYSSQCSEDWTFLQLMTKGEPGDSFKELFMRSIDRETHIQAWLRYTQEHHAHLFSEMASTRKPGLVVRVAGVVIQHRA